MKKFILFSLLGLLLIVNNALIMGENHNKTNWTFLVYIETSHLLHHWVLQNINDMLQTNPAKSVCILIQLHTGKDVAWRY